MSQSNRERQAQYRARRLRAGDNGDLRINTYVTTRTVIILKRLAEHHGLSQRQLLEQLLAQEDQRVAEQLEPGTDAWERYFFRRVAPVVTA